MSERKHLPQKTITVRNMDLSFEGIQKNHWFSDNPFATHFINALHLIFPDGERFFIRSVKQFESKITADETKKRMKAFIGQETHHAKEHEKFVETLREQGYDPDTFLNFYKTLAFQIIEPIQNNTIGAKHSLAMTAALEHFTSILAEAAFEYKNWEKMPAPMRDLLLWHAGEEIEHKSVAYDIYEEAVGEYGTRIFGFLRSSVLLGLFTGAGFLYFVWKDKEKQAYTLENFGKAITELSVVFGGFAKDYFRYFAPDFHPDQIENYEVAEKYFQSIAKKSESKINQKLENKE